MRIRDEYAALEVLGANPGWFLVEEAATERMRGIISRIMQPGCPASERDDLAGQYRALEWVTTFRDERMAEIAQELGLKP